MSSCADIVLETNTESHSLAFRDIRRFGRDSDSACLTRLVVRSGWISAEYDFSFEFHGLVEFLRQLEDVDRTLSGVARLKPDYEEQFISISGDGRGHVLVQGDLVEHSTLEQRVHFAFVTDQTCLRPFIAELREITR